MLDGFSRVCRSLAARLVLLACAFVAVPVFLYGEFSAAEDAKRSLLLSRLQVEGQLIAHGLEGALLRNPQASINDARAALADLDPAGITVRLLFRPNATGAAPAAAVFLVGAIPALAADAVNAERDRLAAAGIIRAVPDSCAGGHALDLHYVSAGGGDEVLTSIVPFTTAAGCWAVVASQSTQGEAGSFLDRPYWESPEVRLASLVYFVLAVLALTLFGGLWLALTRFGREARRVADGIPATRPFVQANRIPELDGVASELDQMVSNLRSTAEAFRFAAEENAHAFKTPIATIAQAVEPLKRILAGQEAAGRPLQVIEASLERLDTLVAASRQLDQVNADLVSPPRQMVDLSRLVEALLDSYGESTVERGVAIRRHILPHCQVRAGIEMMETVIENILENALSFSPAHSTVYVEVVRTGRQVVMSIEDQGPGARPEVLERMFERYVSHRPGQDPSGSPHFGIGLWIVRRNVAAVGGTVVAANRPEGGLRVTVTLPSA